MAIQGVLDRIENNQAVILIEDFNDEFIIEVSRLPKNSEEGTWFDLEKTEAAYKIMRINEDMTEAKQTDVNTLMNQLKKAKKTSKFRRK